MNAILGKLPKKLLDVYGEVFPGKIPEGSSGGIPGRILLGISTRTSRGVRQKLLEEYLEDFF